MFLVRWLAVVLVLAVFVTPLAADAQASAWSAPVGGLRGRLATDRAVVAVGGAFHVWVELENVGSSPVTVTVADPLAFVPELRDTAGPVTTTSARTEVLASPKKVVLAPGATQVVDVATARVDSPRATLDVTTHVWTLGVGRYGLAGRFDAGGGNVLALPPLGLEVR